MLKRFAAIVVTTMMILPLSPPSAGARPTSKYCKKLAQTIAAGGLVSAQMLAVCPRHTAKTKKAKSTQSTGKTVTTHRVTIARPLGVPWCEDNNSAYRCIVPGATPTPPKTKKHKKAKTPTPTQLREVAAQLQLPNPIPRFGPDPSVNEWKMLAVGFPIWLWTDRPTTVSTTAHHDGLDFTLTATWTSTTFTMGDGHSKTCTATNVRPRTLKPATKPSPTCGYVYQTKSKIGHPYTVTAATHWQINWTTNGYTGTFNHTYTGTRTLTIGELQSLING